MARRFLSLILLLLIGAVVGAPYVVGMQMEKLYADYMQKTLAPGLVELKTTQFSRGWFKSTARDSFAATGAACNATNCKPLVVETVIHHGPLALTGILDGTAPLRPVRGVIVSRVDVSPLLPEGSIQPSLPALTSTTIVELNGSADTRLSMLPSQHTLKGKNGDAKLALGGVDGHTSVSADTTRTEGRISFASLSLQDAKGKTFELKGAGLDFNGHFDGSDFIGKMTESVEQVRAGDATGQPFDLQGLAFAFDNKADGNSFDIGFKKVSGMGRDYGPVKIAGEVTGVNRATMNKMQAELQAQQQKAPSEAMGASMQIYQKYLPDLLKSNPELNVRTISIATSDGEVLGNLRVAAGTPTADAAGWMQMLKADFGLQIPAVTLWNIVDAQKQEAAQKAALLTGTPAVLPSQDEVGAEVNRLVQAGILMPKLDANAYVMQASLQGGRLIINGRESGDFNSVMSLITGVSAGQAVVPGR